MSDDALPGFHSIVVWILMNFAILVLLLFLMLCVVLKIWRDKMSEYLGCLLQTLARLGEVQEEELRMEVNNQSDFNCGQSIFEVLIDTLEEKELVSVRKETVEEEFEDEYEVRFVKLLPRGRRKFDDRKRSFVGRWLPIPA